jgi:hypothetical protein
MLLPILFILILISNAVWWMYHRKLRRKNHQLRTTLENNYVYIDELQRRCERYRTSMLTEALAAKTSTKPVVKVYPIQRRNTTWIIENNLN